ncbi:MAG: phosphodiester glycosidase family protein [Planctomycetes bacterium]|nr:phosphodiester glycosidase family protein [Planctomycetota bacterium]
MTTHCRTRTLVALLTTLLVQTTFAQEPQGTIAPALRKRILEAPWKDVEVGVGMTWRRHHFKKLYGAKQSVNLLVIDLGEKRTGLQFARAEGLEKTSSMARGTRAIAAVNGGFFLKDGSPRGFLKIDGTLLNQGSSDCPQVLGVERSGRIVVGECPQGDWTDLVGGLGAGPLLIRKGEYAVPTRADKRHPRTAVGMTARNELIFLTVDGRTESSAGMTLDELAKVLLILGCVEAFNLDGGGSSTMYVRSEGEGEDGIVNFPCDNGKYDHGGERSVSTAVLVLGRDVLIHDEERATLTPEGAWIRIEDEDAYQGDAIETNAPDALAVFTLPVELAGSYDLEVRYPKQRDSRWLDVQVGEETFSLNPTMKAHRWKKLGTITREQPGAVRVEIRSRSAKGFAIDAVRLVER